MVSYSYYTHKNFITKKNNTMKKITKKNQPPVLFQDEINAFLKELFYEDWMGEDDWEMILTAIEAVTGITIETLSKDLQIGLKNGYSIEEQFEKARAYLKKNK